MSLKGTESINIQQMLNSIIERDLTDGKALKNTSFAQMITPQFVSSSIDKMYKHEQIEELSIDQISSSNDRFEEMGLLSKEIELLYFNNYEFLHKN